jgi:hypothetical protein
MGNRRKQILATDGWLQPPSRRRKHFEVVKSSNICARHCIGEIYTYIKSVIFGKLMSSRHSRAHFTPSPEAAGSYDITR